MNQNDLKADKEVVLAAVTENKWALENVIISTIRA